MKTKVIVISALALAIVTVGFIARAKTGDKAGTMASMTSSAKTETPTAAGAVSIQNYKFNPSPIRIKKGDTVTWTNTDIARHNIVIDDGQTETGLNGPLFGKGESFQYTFNTVGTFSYHCSPHPYMHGVVEVTE